MTNRETDGYKESETERLKKAVGGGVCVCACVRVCVCVRARIMAQPNPWPCSQSTPDGNSVIAAGLLETVPMHGQGQNITFEGTFHSNPQMKTLHNIALHQIRLNLDSGIK